MSEPICKVADIIYVRFELIEFEAQKKYFNHFGLMLAHEDDNSIFFRGSGTSPYVYVATKGKENKKNLNDALLTSIAGISAAMKNTG